MEKVKDSILEQIVKTNPFSKNMKIIKYLGNKDDYNNNYKVKLNDKNAVLKIYREGIYEEIEKKLDIQKFFYLHNFPCQDVLEAEGKRLFDTEGIKYSLFDFIEGNNIEKLSTFDTYRIIDLLSQFHFIGKNYPGEVPTKKNKLPPTTKKKFKDFSQEMKNEYLLLDSKQKDKNQIIYGDFHFEQLLKQRNEMFLLDFESVRNGSHLEDFGNFIFFSQFTGFNKSTTTEEILDYFLNKEIISFEEIDNLNDEIKKTSLQYGMGNLWLFEKELINENTLAKRLKPLEKIDKIII